MKTPDPRHHGAFTLLELLVVLAIFTVLFALLLPAIQRVRQTVLRLQCASNLHQIGLAAYQYETNQGSFPAGTHVTGDRYLSSWLNDLTPLIEQEELYSSSELAYEKSPWPFENPPHSGLATPVTLYGCPADSRSGHIGFATRTKTSVAFTSYLGVEGRDINTRDGIFYPDSHTRIADILHGTSNTLFAGERPPSTDEQYGWWYAGAGQNFTGSLDATLGASEINLLPLVFAYCVAGPYQYGPGSIDNECDMFHFWSLHNGGANFLVADGSVHFLTYDVAPIMDALASRAGGQELPMPE